MGILGELWVKLGLKNEGLNKGLDQSKQKVNGFAKYMSKLGGVMAGVFSVAKIIEFTHQTAELANKTAGVKKAFDRLNSPGLLANLRKATMGTVDDLQLMQRAVQAKNFKIPLDQLATYFEFATKMANQTGESVDYLVESIITGLGRQSPLILDNLGISSAELRKNMEGGASMAEALGEIIKKELGSGAAEEIDKTVLATQRLSTAWTNFQIEFGSKTAPIWNKIKDFAAGVLEESTNVLKSDNLNWFQKALYFLTPYGDISNAVDKALSEDAKKTADTATGEIAGGDGGNSTPTKVRQIITDLKKLIELKEKNRDLSANEEEIRQLNDEIAAMKERLKILQMTTEEYRKYRNEQMTPIPEMESGLSGIFDTEYLKENIDKGAAMLDEAQKQWTAKGAALSAITMEQQERITEAATILADSLATGVSNSINELANVIAGVEGSDPGTVVKALLSPLADAAISAGILIMTTGKAIEALRKGLTSFLGVGPIAAGAILVGVGMAAKAGLAAIGNGGTAGGYNNNSVTSYSGGYGVNTSNYAQQSNNYTLSTTLKGQDLLLAIERTQNSNRR